MKKHPLLLLALALCTLAQAQRTGKDYAVFFYVTDFQPGWARLPETAVEASALQTELSSNYNFICDPVRNPTKQTIRNKIREYNQRLTSNDQVFFFFSMHGHYDATSDRGYLVASDGRSNDLYGDTYLSYDDLRTDLAPSKAKHILLALDACHSGSFGIRSKGGPDVPIYEKNDDCATRISKTMQYRGRQYCSSGNKNAKTPAKSVFALRLLEALRKGGDGGIVQFDDLEYWVGKTGNPQPESGSFGDHEASGDFAFVRKEACKTDYVSPQEEKVWQTAVQRNSVEAFDVYLTLYPEGKYVAKAHELKASVPQTLTTNLDGLVLVKGGTFTMGCTSEQQDCGDDEKPIHQVTLSDFYIGAKEVTQKEWQDVMGNNPSWHQNCDECPVENVSWDEVQEFLKKLNVKTGRQYRLPTEAEWEYAARERGRAALFGNGKNIADPGEINFNSEADNKKNYSVVGTYRRKSTPVGSFSPNGLGLYDMSGNVREWCSDWYDSFYYSDGLFTNPPGPSTGSSRVVRGGSYNFPPPNLRLADRNSDKPDSSHGLLGFRLARTP